MVASGRKRNHISLQHRHDGVAGFAFAGLVDGDYAVLPFPAALLIDQRDLGLHRGADIEPGRAEDPVSRHGMWPSFI